MRSTIDFGIDLGTTNSALAVQRGQDTVLLNDSAGQALLPSALHVDAAGTVVVGAAARAKRDADVENTAVEFKRLMGTDEKKTFPASNKALSPEEMSAEVLKALVARAHEPLKAAVITVPAMFQLPQCDATRKAALLAGIEHAPLLQEPIAAAIAHCGGGGENARDGSWLVYDLGGGTFDVSLVRMNGGRLQVVDHDGDNHLGGRDFDRLVVRDAAERVRAAGKLGEFKRTDPAYEDDFARLKIEAERVRMALSKEEGAHFSVKGLGAKSGEFDLEFDFDRAALEALLAPLIQRTILICKKVLSRNTLTGPELRGLVMVGGPTLTPCVQSLLREELIVDAKHQHDPMTIVAKGAALFASTQRLPASFRGPVDANALAVSFEVEAMTTDKAPLLVGKLDPKDAARLTSVRVVRADGGFDSGDVNSKGKPAFAVPLRLAENALNRFNVTAVGPSGAVPLSPSEFTILHGLSVAKPPLSQSVGIMLADNNVAWYLRRGVILPARHTATQTTTVSLKRGQSGDAIKVPIVQGESERADRNKIIGVLHIHADGLSRDLPAGSEVEIHVTLDESASVEARAYVPLLRQWFDSVVKFRMETKAQTQVEENLKSQRDRMSELAAMADELAEEDKGGGANNDARVDEIESLLEEGDRDSIDLADQMVRRMTQEIDQLESTSRKERLEKDHAGLLADVDDLLTHVGEPTDKKQRDALVGEFTKAMVRNDLDTAEIKLEALRDLGMRVYMRLPQYWIGLLNNLMKSAEQRGILDGVKHLITQGQAAATAKDVSTLRRICIEIYEKLPSEDRSKMKMPDVVSNVR